MNQVNVVELSANQRQAAALPPILNSVCQATKKHIAGLVENLFDNTDDALFELADRSQSDQQQEMYFDSMRHVRLHRTHIAQSFLKNFCDSFITLLSPQTEVQSTQENGRDQYTLLEKDELEMTVAVSGIVSKVTSLHSLQIMQLTKRMFAAVAPFEVTERNNPLGPNRLSTAFAESLGGLEVDIKVRIIIMKLFERFVMERMGSVYEQTNQQLVQAGILPDLTHKSTNRLDSNKAIKSQPKQKPSTDTQAASSVIQDYPRARTSIADSVGFDTIQSLLAGANSYDENTSTGEVCPGTGTGTGNNGGLSGVNNFIALPSEQVLAVLSKLQVNANQSDIDTTKQPVVEDLRSVVLKNREGNHTLGQADDDTVNFVGLLFDYILNDRNLAIPMKALIGRLQIPIVKLAIIDKTFFSKSMHPARALLNELSSAGIGWSSAKELKRDTLYNQIESVVHTILSQFDRDPDLFNHLLNEFRGFISKDARRNVLVEQRVKDTEAGKARTTQAKAAVQQVINQKACGLRLPQEVGKFVSEVWSRVLTLCYVKYTELSEPWRTNVETLDNLLWVLQPLSEEKQVDQRDKLVPALLENLTKGMDEVGVPSDELNHFIGWLDDHAALLSRNDRAYLEVDEREDIATPTTLIDEIVLTVEDFKEEPTIDAELRNHISKITEGTWVEITDPQGQIIRCKLTTVTQPGNKYIFVNRRGMKVAEKSQLELAELFKTEKIVLIDESQVFDRALQSVIGNLRELQRANS